MHRNRIISPRQARAQFRKKLMGALPLTFVTVLAALMLAVASCSRSSAGPRHAEDPNPSGFHVESTAFKEGAEIPEEFTCEGENVSPALRWAGPPRGTQSFALIAEDPDAPSGIWVHWVVYDLPAPSRELPGNVPKQNDVPGGGTQGRNDFGGIGYGGPCPPPGAAHRYFFKLYALDATLHLQPGAQKDQVLAAAKGHILGMAQFMARFKR